jgi:hypothetical protein
MSDAPIAKLPRFPFFGHRTLAEIDETARLEVVVSSGTATDDQKARLTDLYHKIAACWGTT